MKAGCADLILQGLKEAGVSIVCTLPDSYLEEVYRKVAADPDFEHVGVTNEWEGASIAAGVWLTGKRAALIMENSGLRVATEPLARLGLTHGIPVVMLMGYRGDVGEDQWYAIPHGITMEPLLHALRIPYVIVRREGEIKRAILNAYKTADNSKYHVAVAFSGEIAQ
ncbi:MAG: thiamine pyrophosphate-binding protein [Nitrospinota bacterium]